MQYPTSKYFFPVVIVILMFGRIASQELTVGTVIDQGSDQAYVLFSPMSNFDTYLIDRSGKVVRQWTSDYVPGLNARLDDDGNLYRAGRDTDSTYLNNAGAGGVIERYSWNGELTWRYRYSNQVVRQHHDFEVMPNGNVLLIAWELKSGEEAIEAGRDPNALGTDELWPDHLVEVKPLGFNQGEIVWEWHIWDHLIQEYDPEKSNYGIVAEHPELIDLNYYETKSIDWIHGNSLEYNEELDQIAFSSRTFNEVWIIDHSTSTAEAASHAGGNSGQGGDILFRWGNPQTYRRGSEDDRQLYGQHGIHWNINTESLVGELVIFNNGNRRPGTDYASIETIKLEIDVEGNYLRENTYLPHEPTSSFSSKDTVEMFAPLFSNVQKLANGNLMLCIGPRGTFIEYDTEGEIIWKYVSPVTEGRKIFNQGDDIGDQFSSNNSVFSIATYSVDFPGFAGKELIGTNVIEGEGTTAGYLPENERFIIYPNPAANYLFVEKQSEAGSIKVFNVNGVEIDEILDDELIHTTHWKNGVYFFLPEHGHVKRVLIQK